MKSAIKTVPLGEVVEIIGGGTPSKSNSTYFGGSIPWATVRDMGSDTLTETEHSITPEGLKASSSKLIPGSEVIIASRVGLGKVCVLQQDTAINQDLRALIPKAGKSVDRRFLFYWFQSIASDVVAAGTGATVQGVKLPFLKQLPFPVVPIEEQRWIVAILDEAFEGLSRARANAEANLKNVRELFDRFTSDVFSEVLAEHGKATLEDACEFITDGTHQTPTYYESGYIFLSAKNVRDGRLDWKEIKFIDEKQHLAMRKRLAPRRGDLLIRKNGVGYGAAALVDRDVEFDVYVSLAVLRPKPWVLPEFLLQFTNSSFAQSQFKDRIKGQGVPNLHLQEIRKVTLPLPDEISTQSKIASKIVNALEATRAIEERMRLKILDLDGLRQSLLQKAFAGELTVKEFA